MHIWCIKLGNAALWKYLLGLQSALATKQLVKYTLFCGMDFHLWRINMQEITMPLLINRCYKRVCFVLSQTPHSHSTGKRGSSSIDVLSVFNDRIGWFEFVLHTVISQITCLLKWKFQNWKRLGNCCHFALRMPSLSQWIVILKTTIKTKLQRLLVPRNENFG